MVKISTNLDDVLEHRKLANNFEGSLSAAQKVHFVHLPSSSCSHEILRWSLTNNVLSECRECLDTPPYT